MPRPLPLSSSLCAIWQHVLGSAFQGEEQQVSWRWWYRNRASGVWRWLWQGADTAACLMDHPRIYDIAAGFRTHLSQPALNPHFKETDSLPEEPTGIFFGFVWAAVYFLFWLCSLMIKAAFDTSAAALNVHLLLLLAHSSLDTSLSISASC